MSVRPTVPGSEEAVEDRVAEATVYRVLAQLFLEPQKEASLEALGRWADRWLEMDPPAPVADALSPIAAVEPAEATALNESFTRLFRGVMPNAPPPPYESLYRDGALFGPSATAVRRTYREVGVDLEESSGELADHLGIELLVVAELREREELEALSSFVREHPLAWFDDFDEAVSTAEPPPFYRGALDLAGATLRLWEGVP